MNILILEDEIPAYQKLLNHIHSEIPEGRIMGWARSIKEAQLLLKTKGMPDLIFSDIQLLDGSSFTLYEETKVSCPIIFCTGFDQYVLKAFQTNGIAYLLKPYSVENFKEAYEKYKILFGEEKDHGIDKQLLSELKQILDSDRRAYKRRFTVKKKDGIKLIDAKDIACFEANGSFSMAIDGAGARHIINFSMADIEEKIDPSKFFRINRSQIINIAFVEKIESHFKNRLAIRMKHTTELLLTSSTKTPDFRRWIEG